MKYLITIFFLSAVLLAANLRGQTVKIDSIIANYGDTVLVPLNFYGYTNMGALTLFIQYDTSALEYIGMTHLVPEGQGTLTNATIIQDSLTVVGIAWSANTGGINFPDGKYMDLKFIFSPGASDLVFYEPLCEIVDWEVNIIPTIYLDGRVDHLTKIADVRIEENEIYAYANKVVIKSYPADEINIQVIDLMGRRVYGNIIQHHGGIQEIILENAPTGVYIVNLHVNDKIISKKIFLRNNN